MTLWTELLGAEVRWVDAGGVRTRTVTQGDGPPVLLLHGRGGHLETWSRTLPALSRRRRVIAADLIGHGLTAAPPGEYSVDRLLGHVVDLLDALRLPRVDLVGQSLGGWVAALLAITRPERVDRLVLVEPAGLQSEQERLDDPRVRAAYERGGRAFAEASGDNVRTRLTGLLADPDLVTDELVEVRRRLYAPDAARAVHQSVRRADNSRWLLTPEQLTNVASPVLLVHGESGHLPTTVLRAAVAALPRARLRTVPGTRQWPHYERPDLVNPEIEKFLEENDDILA
ncbi:alpha/beta fold hydrolase [Micromonospora sp. LOL_023]|uniref:alpha/beta fold hydrolase n=1 Tax=Micromonospora sp. LOL_023 TaxID=3345418 RepID=UPI003A8606A5